ncbi:Shedu anti-phage system protein SduA domain-containing protein [Nostoc sp.]|uniref:Shedu anti-phage system protein SduA domain-containing protein n=1 Tax=Nostoc sp. TaxID=1180 RepID=UPI002FF8D6D8
MILKKTYIIEKGPKEFDIDTYREERNKKYKILLDTTNSEKELQKFFEENPSFIPGAWTPGTKSGHYPLHCALITQPKLQGLTTRIPDFMWIATHSSGWYPTLIEIESPSKNILKNNGQPTSNFTQARNQLEQWKTWFSSASNVQQFLEQYQIPDYIRNERQMKLHMILIYGRRNEFEFDATKSKERMSLMSDGMELMSYDRLSCDRELHNAITIRLNANGKYEALSIPPTFQLGPHFANRLLKIFGINEAFNKTIDITDERREFLKRRCPYWEDWAQNGEKGMVGSSDAE